MHKQPLPSRQRSDHVLLRSDKLFSVLVAVKSINVTGEEKRREETRPQCNNVHGSCRIQFRNQTPVSCTPRDYGFYQLVSVQKFTAFELIPRVLVGSFLPLLI